MKLRRLDRTGVYALAAARLALDDAKETINAEGADDLGVVLGTWTAGGQSTQQFLDALFRSGPTGAPALLFDSTVGNSAASLAGLEFKLRGPNVTVSHKEASGLAAIVTAVDHVREGRARAMLAGGVDAVYETFYKGHDRFNAMSGDAQFSHRAAPFDERSRWIRHRRRRVQAVARTNGRGEQRPHGEILGVVGVERGSRPQSAGPSAPSRSSARCNSRSTTPDSIAARSTSFMRRRTRRRFSIEPKRAPLRRCSAASPWSRR